MRASNFTRRLLYWASVAAGLVLAIVPLPDWLGPFRPDLALLAVIYWILTSPRIAGLGYAWLAGLFLDVLRGMTLGQHALAFVLVAFLAHRVQLRMRMFPILHQAGAVMVLLAVYHFVLFWTDGLTGHSYTGWNRWLPVLSGALLWPLIAAGGDTLGPRAPRTRRPGAGLGGAVRLKDHWAEQRLFTRRVFAATVVIFLIVAALGARLYYLQVVRHQHFSDLSQGNRIRIEPLPPSRGLILDRHGEPLALNRPAYQLELIREQTPDVEDTLARLVQIGLLADTDLERTRRAIRARRGFDAVPIRLQLSEEELARFAVNRPDFPGVEVRPRLTRHYPQGGTGVHALGYVAAISEADQQQIDVSNYSGTTLIGKLGVERAFEGDLHGETGYQQLLVNAQGRRVERVGLSTPDLTRREPVAGSDLYLTLDAGLQRVAEEALAGQRAAVVAIDPRNGDILAFVSTPTFDPNGFARGLTYAEYGALSNDIDIPLYDRALRGVYPPGSTIKPLVALAALELGVVRPEGRRLCRGAFQLPGSSHRYRDWKRGGHGSVDMHMAIAVSCDVYFYGISAEMGIDRMHGFLSKFGLGEKTGIDIAGERTGTLPSTDWKRKAFKRKDLQTWFPGETVIAGIGQGYMLTTPLQLAHATATLAMRGQRFAPRLVRAVRDASSGEVRELPPRPLPPVQVSDPTYWDVVIGGMVGVTNDPWGTARRSQAGAPYKIAGKTGTAQVFSVGQNQRYNEKDIGERLRDHALFVAFAPADDPQIALAIVVENGRSGSGTAAPIARKVFDAFLLPPVLQPELAVEPPAGPPTVEAAPAAEEEE